MGKCWDSIMSRAASVRRRPGQERHVDRLHDQHPQHHPSASPWSAVPAVALCMAGRRIEGYRTGLS
jgi:hypothetical protein